MAVLASLRLANQATLLEQLLGRRAASRAELAKATGMSKPTVGKIIDDLVRAGVVEELRISDDGRPGLGRPGKQLRLATTRNRFVVVELGVESTRISALPPAPPEHERWEVQFKTPTSAEAWQETCRPQRGEPRRQAAVGGAGQHAGRGRRTRGPRLAVAQPALDRAGRPAVDAAADLVDARRPGARGARAWRSASSAPAPTATTSCWSTSPTASVAR